MPTIKNVPLRPQPDASFVYACASSFFRYYYLISSRLQVEGVDHVPWNTGAVVVCNHTRGNDYFPFGVSFPRWLKFMIKIEAFQWHPVLEWLLRHGGAFPVDRGAGDLAALHTAVEVVKAGGALAMFPEGHRSEDGKLQKGHSGAVRIALDSGAPVIPVVVLNAEAGWSNFPRFWKRPVVLVRIGKPFYLEGASSADRRAISRGHKRIMTSIAEMLPEEMRGYWADAVRAEAAAAAAPTADMPAPNLDLPPDAARSTTPEALKSDSPEQPSESPLNPA